MTASISLQLRLEGLVFLDLGLQVGGVAVGLVTRHLHLLPQPRLRLVDVAQEPLELEGLGEPLLADQR